jgi:hypothetical protein
MMRHLRWIPFTFLAGAHGFALFAPYALLLAGVHLYHHGRRRN